MSGCACVACFWTAYPLQFIIAIVNHWPVPTFLWIRLDPESSTLLLHDNGYHTTGCWHLCSQSGTKPAILYSTLVTQFIYCFTTSPVLFFFSPTVQSLHWGAVDAEACIWASAPATRVRFPGGRLGRRLSSPHIGTVAGPLELGESSHALVLTGYGA